MMWSQKKMANDTSAATEPRLFKAAARRGARRALSQFYGVGCVKGLAADWDVLLVGIAICIFDDVFTLSWRKAVGILEREDPLAIHSSRLHGSRGA